MPRTNKSGNKNLTQQGSHVVGGTVTPAHTTRVMFEHITPHWLHMGGAVSDEGGLNIQWSSGGVFCPIHERVEIFQAQTANVALTDDAVNYLYYNDTSTLQTGTATVDHLTEVLVATMFCADGDIVYVHQEEHAGEAIAHTMNGLSEVFPAVVVHGLIVSADTTAFGPALDLTQSAGHFHLSIHEAVTAAQIDSSATDIWRWYRDGPGVDYTHDADDEIDTTNYDNADAGGVPIVIPVGKWVRSVCFTEGTRIHWVYPTALYNNITDALNAPDPAMPTGLLGLPKTTAIVYVRAAATLPAAGSDQWIDVRPLIGASASNAAVTDHGNLSGLADDDHTQYILHSEFAVDEGFMRKTAAGTYTAHKSNLAAAVAPGAANDTTEGYSVGSIWIDTTADTAYMCVDATAANAVWADLAPPGGALMTHEVLESRMHIDATTETVVHGDLIFGNGHPYWARLLPGIAGKVLTTQGVGADPTWETPTVGDVTAAAALTANYIVLGDGAKAVKAGAAISDLYFGDGAGIQRIYFVSNDTQYIAYLTGTGFAFNSNLIVSGTLTGVTTATASTSLTTPIVYGAVAVDGTLTLAGSSGAAAGDCVQTNSDGGRTLQVCGDAHAAAGSMTHQVILGGTTPVDSFVDRLIITNDGYWCGAAMYAHSGTAAHNPFFRLARSRGTAAVPTTVANGDTISRLAFTGYCPSGSYVSRARIDAIVSGVPALTDIPTDIVVYSGSAAATESFRVKSDQNILVASTNELQFLDVNAKIWSPTSTILSVSASYTLRLYGGTDIHFYASAAVQMRLAATTLTFEAGATDVIFDWSLAGHLKMFNGAAERLRIGTLGIGFQGADDIAKPTIVGARDDPEAALANLLTELANYGLITDSTTAS